MKNRYLFSTVILTVMLTVAVQSFYVAAALSSNIVSNPGFESGMTGWLPKHVSNATPDRILGTEGGSATVVNGIGRNGSKALKVVQGNQVEGGALTAWARAEYHFLPGEVPKVGSAYLYTVWVKAESIPDNVTPSIQLIMGLGADQGDEFFHYQDEVLASGTLTTEWQKYTGVTRMMSFEQQDSPDTQYKGMIGFHSSPKYPGANPGFDQGILDAAPLKEFYAYTILSPGPSVAIPLIIDDVEVLKPIYNFVFDKEDSDSKILFKDSGSTVYIHEGTDIAVFRDVKEEAFFIHKLDFNSATKDAILTLNLADDFKIEVASTKDGPWTKVATGKKYMMAGAYKADEIIDLTAYLNKNNENSVYVKYSDNTMGTTGTAKHGLSLRALEVFSKTGQLEFNLNPLPTPTTGTSSTASSAGNSSAGSSAFSSTAVSEADSTVTGDSSDSASTDAASSEATSIETSSSEASSLDNILDASVIKPLYEDISINYTTKTAVLQNTLTVGELQESFKLGETYTIRISDQNDKEMTDTDKNVADGTKIVIYKDGTIYETLTVAAPGGSGDTTAMLIIIAIAVLIAVAGAVIFVLFKKKRLFSKER
ncbi:MAG: carbohydrate binding domain-containing protein [Saccharofermentanales bacterium]